MADEQPSSYDGGEGGDAPDTPEYDDHTTPAIADATTAIIDDDYVDEPIEDYVVNLVVDEQPDGATLSPDLVNAAITDIHGNIIGRKPGLYDYTTSVYDELNGNGTGITGSKGLFGWSPLKLILVGLLALCILALILGILFFVFGKKFKKNKRSPPAATTTTTTKAAVTKGILSDPKYHTVPNV
ncbi:hypothetical protein I4U23_021603 [Adineta vaga]|nr:hypothetical protein I4U23_021603 [Adineta vaga]